MQVEKELVTKRRERRDAMKPRTVLACAMFVLLPVPLNAQETSETAWEIMPSVSIVRHFAGDAIGGSRHYGPVLFGPDIFYPTEARYSGTGLEVRVRCFHESIPNLALTLGGGITWYSHPEQQPVYGVMSQALAGVGEMQHNRDFTTFPLSVGVQLVVPRNGRQALMFFAGGEFNMNFVDGDMAIRQQAKLGYTVLGGFAVKVFEFGIRYSAFSDMRNLGAHIGIRFNPFTL